MIRHPELLWSDAQIAEIRAGVALEYLGMPARVTRVLGEGRLPSGAAFKVIEVNYEAIDTEVITSIAVGEPMAFLRPTAQSDAEPEYSPHMAMS